MFGLGFTEILVICVVILIFFGPERLPGLARTVGQTMAQIRRAVDEFKYELMSSPGENNRVFQDEPPRLRVADLTTESELHGNCERCSSSAGSCNVDVPGSDDARGDDVGEDKRS